MPIVPGANWRRGWWRQLVNPKSRDLTLDRRRRGQAFQLGHGMVNRFTAARSTMAMWRWGSPAIVMLAVMAALTALTADAAARQERPKPPIEATAPRDA